MGEGEVKPICKVVVVVVGITVVVVGVFVGVDYLTERNGITEYLREMEEEVERLHNELEFFRHEMIELHEMKEIWDELEIGRFKATSYSPHDSRTGIDHDGDPTRTALGTFPSRGTFAVNPRVIPYRSKMLIVGDGWFEHGEALDTGGAMRRTHDLVDVYRDTYEEAYDFGRQDVVVIYKSEG